MSKIAFFILIITLGAFNFACSGGETNNSGNAANTANIPPEFQTNPINVNGNTAPGIDPKNINVAPNPNGTPTPGIPAPGNVNIKPSGSKTPGIPSEKELKQMQNNSMGNVNSRQSMTDSDKTPQPKTNRKP